MDINNSKSKDSNSDLFSDNPLNVVTDEIYEKFCKMFGSMRNNFVCGNCKVFKEFKEHLSRYMHLFNELF